MYGVVSQPRPSSCAVINHRTHEWVWFLNYPKDQQQTWVSWPAASFQHHAGRHGKVLKAEKINGTVGQIVRKLLSLSSHLSEKSKLEWTDLHDSCQIFAFFPSLLMHSVPFIIRTKPINRVITPSHCPKSVRDDSNDSGQSETSPAGSEKSRLNLQ